MCKYKWLFEWPNQSCKKNSDIMQFRVIQNPILVLVVFLEDFRSSFPFFSKTVVALNRKFGLLLLFLFYFLISFSRYKQLNRIPRWSSCSFFFRPSCEMYSLFFAASSLGGAIPSQLSRCYFNRFIDSVCDVFSLTNKFLLRENPNERTPVRNLAWTNTIDAREAQHSMRWIHCFR